jgi:hypothetical protein
MHIDLHLRVPARLTAVGTKLTVMDVRSLVRYRVISGPESPGAGPFFHSRPDQARVPLRWRPPWDGRQGCRLRHSQMGARVVRITRRVA